MIVFISFIMFTIYMALNLNLIVVNILFNLKGNIFILYMGKKIYVSIKLPGLNIDKIQLELSKPEFQNISLQI